MDDHEAFNTDVLFDPRMPDEFRLPNFIEGIGGSERSA